MSEIPPRSAYGLAVLRIAIYGTWMVNLLMWPIERGGQLPLDWFSPFGVARSIPWAFYRFVLQYEVLIVLRYLLLVLTFFLAMGVRPFRPLALLAAILLLGVDALGRV
jgi:hypothetical protein